MLTLGDHSIAGLASALKDINEPDDGEPRITGPSLKGEGLEQRELTISFIRNEPLAKPAFLESPIIGFSPDGAGNQRERISLKA